MLTDRGNKKWTSLMLPEHVKFLRDWEYHEKNDQERPEISDHQLNIMDDIIGYSMDHCLQVHITFYDHSIRQKIGLYGEVKKVDSLLNMIHFLSEDGFSKRIKVSDILELSLR